MNANQFTQKSAEAIQNAQALAVDYGNTQIEQEHLAHLSACAGRRFSSPRSDQRGY